MEGLLEELDEEMTIDPSAVDFRDVYKLMTGLIVPRPIAFVSTIDSTGMRNLAPFSFFAGVSANPPVICFSPMIRGTDGARKDTLRNIEQVPEFVVNVVSEDLAAKMNACSADVPPDVDEFSISGLTPLPSTIVRPARVKEARASMECRLFRIVPVSDKPLGAHLVLGEIVLFHLADELFSNYRIDPDILRPIGRMAGPTYARTTDRFDMPRPSAGTPITQAERRA